MNDTKRTILAFAVSFLILMGWYAFFTPQALPPVARTDEQAQTQAAPAPLASQPSQPALITPLPSAVAEEKVTIANELVTLHLTSKGAAIEQITLAKYKDKAGSEGRPLNLFNGGADVAGLTKFADAPLRTFAVYSILKKTDSSVTFALRTPEGLLLEKTYELKPGRYDLDLAVKVVNEGKDALRDRLSVYMVGDFTAGHSRDAFRGPSYSVAGGYEEVEASDAAKGQTFGPNLNWVGVVENYFLWAFIPVGGTDLGGFEMDSAGKDIIRIAVQSPALDVPAGGSVIKTYRFFAGPKEKSVLVAAGGGLDSALYYGWFTIIAKPLLQLLNFLYGIFGNYGVAIIMLTLVIKLIFWPLSAKSYKSMARMKELQPKIDKLKERYGDDREKMNQEMMQLWKTHKVNPFSGCLPILVQIPVFIALYRLLMSSIEIRHAPFVFWLTDLSAPDHFYITPLLMGGSMFLQQKMTPATGMGDGQMKFMLYGMPILFTWLFKDFASGLVVYWLMNNVFSIAQQWLMMRNAGKKA